MAQIGCARSLPPRSTEIEVRLGRSIDCRQSEDADLVAYQHAPRFVQFAGALERSWTWGKDRNATHSGAVLVAKGRRAISSLGLDTLEHIAQPHEAWSGAQQSLATPSDLRALELLYASRH